MALVSVQHKTITATARQFDGSYAALTDIMDARGKVGLNVSLLFDNTGASITRVTMSGGQLGATLTVNQTDWVVFPPNLADPAYVITAAQGSANWTIV